MRDYFRRIFVSFHDNQATLNDLRLSNIIVGENIIATIKRRNNFGYPLEMVIYPILR